MTETNTESLSLSLMDAGSLAEVEKPKPLPKGTYPATVVKIEKQRSKNTNKEYFSVSLRVLPDAYPADYTDGNPDGTTLNYMRLSPDMTNAQNKWRIKQFFLACGFGEAQLATMGREINLTQLIGAELRVEVDHEPFDGEDRPAIKGVSAR